MSIHDFGRAGRAPVVLAPRQGTLLSYLRGPFTAVLRPTLQARQRGAYPSVLYLDLLAKQPDVDGVGAERADREARKQSVTLSGFNATEFTVVEAAQFALDGDSNFVALGLFDETSQLVAWGTVLPHLDRSTRPALLELRSHQVRVKRI